MDQHFPILFISRLLLHYSNQVSRGGCISYNFSEFGTSIILPILQLELFFGGLPPARKLLGVFGLSLSCSTSSDRPAFLIPVPPLALSPLPVRSLFTRLPQNLAKHARKFSEKTP